MNNYKIESNEYEVGVCCAAFEKFLLTDYPAWGSPDHPLSVITKNHRTYVCISDNHDGFTIDEGWKIYYCPWCGKLIDIKEVEETKEEKERRLAFDLR